MKKAFVLCALVGVAVYATTAWSASTTDPTVARLQKDVATLKAQVKTLQKDDKAAKGAINVVGDIAVTGVVVGVCTAEVTADALQGTWSVIDQISSALQAGKTYFGPQTTSVTATLQGQDICAAVNVTRSPVTTGLVPTIAQYQALLAPFHSSSSSLSYAIARLLTQKLHLK